MKNIGQVHHPIKFFSRVNFIQFKRIKKESREFFSERGKFTTPKLIHKVHSFNPRKIHSPAVPLTRVLLNVAYLCAFKYCVSSLLCRQTIHQQRLLVCRRFYEVTLVAVRKCLVKCFMMRVSSSRLFYKTHRCQRPLKLNFRLKLKAAVADVVPNRSCLPGIRGDITRTSPVLFEIHR